MGSDSYDVPAGIVNTAISEINVSGGVTAERRLTAALNPVLLSG